MAVHDTDRRSDVAPSDHQSYRQVQDGLRAAGHYLDQSGFRLLNLIALREGITLTVTDPGNRQPAEAILLTHEELRSIAAASRRQRGRPMAIACPDPIFLTGYEDFLRALGTVVSREWNGFRLLRCGDTVVLCHGARDQRRQKIMRRQDVHDLLNHAFRLRRRAERQGAPPLPGVGELLQVTGSGAASDARAGASYETCLDALGFHLDRTNASDVLVADIAGGLLVSFLASHGEQMVTTVDNSQLARFRSQARRIHLPHRSPHQYRARLNSVGRHLDARHASAIMVQETGTGMLVSYIGPARVYNDDWGEKERLAEHLRDLLSEEITVQSW